MLNTGYLYLQSIYQELNLSKFFDTIVETDKDTFDWNEINRFMTFERILRPASMRSTQLSFDNYYERPDIEYSQILHYLDTLDAHYDDYIAHLFKYRNKLRKSASVCSFYWSGFSSEIEEDEDYVDEVTHEDMLSLRKIGFKAGQQPDFIAQMGIFLDSDGIPISMGIRHGAESEQTMTVPCASRMVQMLDKRSFVYCADAGLGSEGIQLFSSMGGRTFIVTQSVEKLSDALQAIIFTDDHYRRVSDNKKVTLKYLRSFDKTDPDRLVDYNDRAYKVIPVDNLEDLGLGELNVLNISAKKSRSKESLSQYIIVTFSRKYLEYQRYLREKRIESVKGIIAAQSVNSGKAPYGNRHLITIKANDADGNPVNAIYSLDEDVVKHDEQYDGFCAVAVNLRVLDDDGNPIHSEITRILDTVEHRCSLMTMFRILETRFNNGPVSLPSGDHITGHFMICYTALLVFCLLQKMLNEIDKDQHFTEEDILDTLTCMNVMNVDDYFYRATYCGSDTLRALELLANLGLNKKNYLPKDLNAIVRSVK